MMAHKVHFSILVLILLCCDAQGELEVEDSIGHKEREEYSRFGLLQNSTNGSSGNPATSTSHQTIRYSCPWPYQNIATHCLHRECLLLEIYGWMSARKYCESLDGDLAWFEDKDLPPIIGYLNVVNSVTYFVGGRQFNSTSDFEWVNGQKLPDTSSPLWYYRDYEDYNCVSLSNNNGYKLSNQDCMSNKYS
ncbi:uncharacterized protein LOC135226745 [Macrobrachium nipponense]|uniref:uncharacterized protein LOC135226745 n=1 Tax=Macrobrachium nipponense TaxID=159736 RepID=UPI0030C7FA2D